VTLEAGASRPVVAPLRRALTSALNLPPAIYGSVLLLLAALILRPVLLGPVFFLAIVGQAAPLGMVALGQSLVMRCRSIDLSIAGVFVVSDFIVTSGYFSSWPGAALIVLCLLFGATVGAINGVLITRVRASAVIVTLGMSIVLVGVVVAFSNYSQPGEVPAFLRAIGSGDVHGVPISLLIWFAIAIPTGLGLGRSVYGSYLSAVGANPQAAALSGIPYLRIVFIAHVVSAVFATIGGLLLAGFVGLGSTTLGQDLVLNSIAAVILGGINFGGGAGGTFGPMVGAFMLTFLFNFLNSFGLGEPAKYMMQGGIIAIAAWIYALGKR
jgi:ribose transport system permease protein